MARLTGTCGSFQLDQTSQFESRSSLLSFPPSCPAPKLPLLMLWVSAKRLQIMLSVTQAVETQHIHQSVVEETVLFRYKYQRKYALFPTANRLRSSSTLFLLMKLQTKPLLSSQTSLVLEEGLKHPWFQYLTGRVRNARC